MKALNRKEVLVNAKANGTLDSFKPLTRDEAFTKKALGGAPVWYVTVENELKDENGNLVTYDMVRRHKADIYFVRETDDEDSGYYGVQYRPTGLNDAGDLGDGTAGVIYYYLGKGSNPTQAPGMEALFCLVPIK